MGEWVCRSFVSNVGKLSFVLFLSDLLPFLFWGRYLTDCGLNVGQGDIDFWMFELVVLVETALTAI